MHVALLVNGAFLHEERATLEHLVVGLMDEGVGVVQVLPDGRSEDDICRFGDVVTWRDTSWGLMWRLRISELANELGKLNVNVVHALDNRLWQPAIALATRMDIPAVLSAWSYADTRRCDGMRRAVRAGRAGFVAPNGPLATAIIERLNLDAVVEVIPPGVHLADVEAAEPDEQPSALVTASGTMDENYDALFRAIKAVIADHPTAHFFLDGRDNDQHSLWQPIKQYDLNANTSMVPKRLPHHDLLRSAEALIEPQAQGRYRTLSLEAMAHGLPVLAREDPWIDHFMEDQNAWVVDGPDAQRWEKLIRRVIEKPDRAQELGKRARQWIANNRLAAGYVVQTLELYRRVTGESMRFPQAQAAGE